MNCPLHLLIFNSSMLVEIRAFFARSGGVATNASVSIVTYTKEVVLATMTMCLKYDNEYVHLVNIRFLMVLVT